LSKLIKLLIFGLVGLLILAAFNFKNLKRLATVNSMFDEDKIVHNFSNMDEALFSSPLPISGEKHVWPVDLQPLPLNFESYGEKFGIEDVMLETKTTAMVVVKDGTIVYEDYFLGTEPEDQRISWSMSKSFVSSLIGVALQDGVIKSLDDQVTDYAPLLKGSAYDAMRIISTRSLTSIKWDGHWLWVSLSIISLHLLTYGLANREQGVFMCRLTLM